MVFRRIGLYLGWQWLKGTSTSFNLHLVLKQLFMSLCLLRRLSEIKKNCHQGCVGNLKSPDVKVWHFQPLNVTSEQQQQQRKHAWATRRPKQRPENQRLHCRQCDNEVISLPGCKQLCHMWFQTLDTRSSVLPTITILNNNFLSPDNKPLSLMAAVFNRNRIHCHTKRTTHFSLDWLCRCSWPQARWHHPKFPLWPIESLKLAVINLIRPLECDRQICICKKMSKNIWGDKTSV